MSAFKELTKGLYKENPVFRLALGLCPALAVSTSVKNALGMGAAATFVLLGSNIVISLLGKIIPATSSSTASSSGARRRSRRRTGSGSRSWTASAWAWASRSPLS